MENGPVKKKKIIRKRFLEILRLVSFNQAPISLF